MANKFKLNRTISQHHLDQMYVHRVDSRKHPRIIPRSLLGVDPSFVFFIDVGKNKINYLMCYRIVGTKVFIHECISPCTLGSASADKDLLEHIKDKSRAAYSQDDSYLRQCAEGMLDHVKPLFDIKHNPRCGVRYDKPADMSAMEWAMQKNKRKNAKNLEYYHRKKAEERGAKK